MEAAVNIKCILNNLVAAVELLHGAQQLLLQRQQIVSGFGLRGRWQVRYTLFYILHNFTNLNNISIILRYLYERTHL